MKKSTKKFTGSVATLATVASIIAPSAAVFAAETSVQDLVSWAEQTKNFYDFNMAFKAVLALPAAEQPAYLARLAKVEEAAKTPDIKAVLKTMDELVANKDLGNYVKLEQLINDTVKETKNNLYLRGELTTWGKGMVYTADVNAAIAAVNNAWTLKTPASVAAAKLAAAKVVNAGSQAWLVGQISEVQKTMSAYVEGVKSLSATQVEVKFSKAVSKASLFVDGVSGAFKADTVTFSSIDDVLPGDLSGKLSVDGTTLTVTATNKFEKRYDVVVDGLKATDGAAVVKYSDLVTFAADTTAPVVVSTTKTSAGSFKVVFSEPLRSLGTVSYKLADGTFVSGTETGVTDNFVAGAKEVTFKVGSEVAATKTVVATFVGTQDMAYNLLTPNPATVSFVKGDKDGVAPVVTSVTQTGAKTFAVKFSEELLATPSVEVSGYSSIAKDANDPTVYNVTTAAALEGVLDVKVSNFIDLSGEAGTTVSKIVTFVKDEVAPKAVTSVVSVDELNRKEYLEVTFDKDVELASTASVNAVVSYVKDYVTTNAGSTGAKSVAYKAASNKKVVRVELATLLNGIDVKGAVYTLDLAFDGITNGAGYEADDAVATFTRGEDGTAANETVLGLPTVTADVNNNNKVNVLFPVAVDGASAVNVANYRIDGAVVKSVTLSPVAEDGTQLAVLNLQAGSNGFTGVRNINIANVKALGSIKTMAPYFTNKVSLNENVAPVVTSAKLTSTTTIKLTFSEAVKDTLVTDDFEVLVGGKAYATPVTRDIDAAATGVTTVTITIPAVDSTVLGSGLSLKAITDSLDTTDLVGNKLSVPANIVVTQ